LDKSARAEEIRKVARELMSLAEKVHDRIGDEGEVLGWNGFHVDLDLIEEACGQLRTMVRS
jgi:hypothetical protein